MDYKKTYNRIVALKEERETLIKDKARAERLFAIRKELLSLAKTISAHIKDDDSGKYRTRCIKEYFEIMEYYRFNY